MKLFKKIFGYCYHCERWFVYPKRRRMSTAYEHDESNFCTECEECFERTEEYWEDMWDEYNSERY
ncbi:hypothetical protein G9F71_008945 [Clostridium sp. FP2]|uniref:hypothetical protein n=1 Tax=Clostridium sp. FP2 TaxID=2724481 RepID=UPI0013E93BF9|nr:hypothetical protein [Clostridium sp. FP2]MBZ9622981.1 hypothetical protein [Clostridium sp. FP2]